MRFTNDLKTIRLFAAIPDAEAAAEATCRRCTHRHTRPSVAAECRAYGLRITGDPRASVVRLGYPTCRQMNADDTCMRFSERPGFFRQLNDLLEYIFS